VRLKASRVDVKNVAEARMIMRMIDGGEHGWTKRWGLLEDSGVVLKQIGRRYVGNDRDVEKEEAK